MPHPSDDIRNITSRPGPRTGSGDGAAYRSGYGPGGLGSGAEPNDPGVRSWDAPGVTPEGRRTGTPYDGLRIATGEEGVEDPENP